MLAWTDARVLRAPRRKSDTQQRGSAEWELRHTVRAAQLGVAPAIHDLWFAKHARREWTSGLYLVTDRYHCDLDELLTEHPTETRGRLHRGHRVADGRPVLQRLAEAGLFVYDLKPSNLMVRLPTTEEPDIDVRVIDFGNDFAEWDIDGADTPVSDMLRRHLTSDAETRERIAHVLFAAMLVQLASTTTQRLREDRRSRMDLATRRRIDPLCHTRVRPAQ